MVNQILPLYGIQPAEAQTETFGDGLINHTWKVAHKGQDYILQRVNHEVFKNPAAIDDNLRLLELYLKDQHPGYLFISPLPALSGDTLIHTSAGYFRLFPFITGSHTVNVLEKKESAFEAAKQFGRFSALLQDFDTAQLKITLPDFHDLGLRYRQFLQAIDQASAERKEKAAGEIAFIIAQQDIVDSFHTLQTQPVLPVRVIHHDTKISNVLFDEGDQGIAVIDLDTVMPGYFISDVGDMMRTYLSAAGEEETDLSKITVRTDFFKAIYEGYMVNMQAVLTETEKSYFSYAGKFMILMQGIRFITDYLEDDRYYGRKYENHNLDRGRNQLTLLQKYLETEDQLQELIKSSGH